MILWTEERIGTIPRIWEHIFGYCLLVRNGDVKKIIGSIVIGFNAICLCL